LSFLDFHFITPPRHYFADISSLADTADAAISLSGRRLVFSCRFRRWRHCQKAVAGLFHFFSLRHAAADARIFADAAC
jgi:hypothetical protein